MKELIKTIFISEKYMKTLGVIRLEIWPEGLCLWVGGKLVWKQWETK